MQYDVVNLKGSLDFKGVNINESLFDGGLDTSNEDGDIDNEDDNQPLEELRAFLNDEEEEDDEVVMNQKGAEFISLCSKPAPSDKVFIFNREKNNIRFFHVMSGLLLTKACMNVFVTDEPSPNIDFKFQPDARVRKLQHYTPKLR